MKPSLRVGNTAEVTALVTEDMCPAFDGVILHRLYSTWSMAHHMEVAARKVLSPYLQEHEEGIGTHISIDHLEPTPVGRTVRIVAEAVDVDETTLVCEVKAYDGDRLVGRGRQIQRVLPKKKLKSLIERAKR
ncbi:MAG: hotdog domain-containing protein [Phycisphaerales bacterium]